MKKEADVRQKLFAIDLLRILKESYTYREMSEFLELPVPVISRYVNGHVLPTSQRAREIIKMFKERYFFKSLKNRVVKTEENVYDLTNFIQDVKLQRIVAKILFNDLSSLEVDKVLTAAVGGVPIATFISEEFGSTLVIASERKEGSVEALEERIMYLPSVEKYLYMPKDSIKPKDSVLIVDDIARTGLTLKSLIKLVNRCKGKTVGIFVVYEIGNVLEKIKRKYHLTVPVKSYVKLE
jgi:adenine/guanine phosphoribosyltransferase-like PRPP-binding protein